MGTVGTYHYDDAECESFIELTRRLVARLADEVEAQGPGYLLAFLELLRQAVLDVLAGRRPVLNWGLGATPDRGDGDGHPRSSGASGR